MTEIPQFSQSLWAGQFRRDYWLRICLLVGAMAQTGFSTLLDLGLTLPQIPARALRRLGESLANCQPPLAEKVSLPSPGGRQLTVLTLTEDGNNLAKALGMEPVRSDWKKIVDLHQGKEQKRHAALVLLIAHQARLRGWQAEVMPFNPSETPWFQPDLKLTDPQGWAFYTEVETRSRVKPRKWVRLREVNLAVPSSVVRRYMVQRLKAMGIPGKATDLQTLLGQETQLWAESW